MNKKEMWEIAAEYGIKELGMYSIIHSLADNEVGYCFATNKGIAEKIGMSDRSVTRFIGDLKEHDLIKVIEIGKKGNHVDERRIYVEPIAYIRDIENEENLTVTTMEKDSEGMIVFYNELNPKEKDGNGSGPGKTRDKWGIDKTVHRGIDKTVHRGIDKVGYGTISNITISNSTNKVEDEIFPLLQKIMKKNIYVSRAVCKVKGKSIGFYSKCVSPFVKKYGGERVFKEVEALMTSNKEIHNIEALFRSKFKGAGAYEKVD